MAEAHRCLARSPSAGGGVPQGSDGADPSPPPPDDVEVEDVLPLIGLLENVRVRSPNVPPPLG